MNDFSFSELQFVHSLIKVKPALFFANALNRTEGEVQDLINKLSNKSGRVPFKKPKPAIPPTPKQLMIIERRRMKQEKVQCQEKKRLESIKQRNIQNAAYESRKKVREKKLPTRALNLSGTIRVQLNAKTIVWVKPGTDIDKLKMDLKIK